MNDFKNTSNYMYQDFKESYEQSRKESTKWNWLSNFFPYVEIDYVGGMVPFQAWGKGLIKDYPFYYRERGGIAHLRIGFKDDKEAFGSESLYSSSTEVEEFRSGTVWIETFFNLFEKLERSKFLYGFPAKELKFSDPNDINTASTDFNNDGFIYGWGHSVKEAYDDTKTIDSYLLSKGWTAEIQEKIWKMKHIDPFPLARDHRIFPDKEPNFKLNVPERWRNDNGDIEFNEKMVVTSSGILEID